MCPNWMNKNYFKLAAFVVLVIFIVGVFLAEQHEPERPLWLDGIDFENVDWDKTTGQIKAYVWNFGSKYYNLSQIYVNGTLDNDCLIKPRVLGPNQTAEITLSETYTVLPKQVTIEINTDNQYSVGHEHTFIGFKMLRVYWDENTSKIKVLVTNIGDYPEVNFEEIYVNGTLDDKVFVTKKYIPASQAPRSYEKTYEISLSGLYITKPKEMQLKIVTSEGLSFELESPFDGGKSISMHINSIKWFEDTGQIKFLVYNPTSHFLEKEQPIAFDQIYINGTLDESAVVTRIYGETYDIALSRIYPDCPSMATVKVVTDFGAYCESYDNNLVG